MMQRPPPPPPAANGKNGNISNNMLASATPEDLSCLVLTIQDEYAKLSKDKATADENIKNLNAQYKDALDEICSMSSRVHTLEHENEEVRSMMETQSVQFESSVSEIASIENLKREADQALKESESQTIAMREALVAEISRLTAEMSKLSNEIDEVTTEKNSIEEENNNLHNELVLARRDAERARLEGTMSNEQTSKQLQATEIQLTNQLNELQSKFNIERSIVDTQKLQINKLEGELTNTKDDSQSAINSYEVAISELNNQLLNVQSDNNQDVKDLQSELSKLKKENNDLASRVTPAEQQVQTLQTQLTNLQKDMEATRDEYESRISEHNSDMEHITSKYETQITTSSNEANTQRDRAITLQQELNKQTKELTILQGET